MARQRSADYDSKRWAIRDAAASLFAEHGFYGSSMSDLADRCGVTKSGLYHYYESKEAVLFDVLHEHIGKLQRMVKETDAETMGWDPVQRLELIVHRLLMAYASADAKHKVQLNELNRLPEPQRTIIVDMERDIVRIVAATLTLINPRLAEVPGLLKPVTMSLFGFLNWHYMWFREDGPLDRPGYAKLATRLFLDGAKVLP